MKRDEVLAVLDDQHNELLSAGSFSGEGCWFRNGQEEEVVADYAKAREVIASALDDAERYRWLRVRIAGSDHVAELVEFNNWKDELGREVDTAIDTARAAAAGGEELT